MPAHENGATTAVYGRVISQRRGEEANYHHFDAFVSTRELTDEGEDVVSTNLYEAWGVDVASTGTPLVARIANPKNRKK